MERAEEIARSLINVDAFDLGGYGWALEKRIADALRAAHASGKLEGIADGRRQVESGALISMSAAKALSEKEYERGAKEFRERAVAEVYDLRHDGASFDGDTLVGCAWINCQWCIAAKEAKKLIESLPLTVETKEK